MESRSSTRTTQPSTQVPSPNYTNPHSEKEELEDQRLREEAIKILHHLKELVWLHRLLKP